MAPDSGRQGQAWDRWYEFLTEKHGLSKKPGFVGMSKGGVNEFNWGVAHPDKVACIYADNPALYDEDFAKLPELAKHDVPLLHVCGTEDFLLQRNTLVVKNLYHQLGGSITVIMKEGKAHHPHSLKNPELIADWIEGHMQPSSANRPAFADASFTKSYYYSVKSFVHLSGRRKDLCNGPRTWVHGIIRPLRCQSFRHLQNEWHGDSGPEEPGSRKALGVPGGRDRPEFNREPGTSCEGLPHRDTADHHASRRGAGAMG